MRDGKQSLNFRSFIMHRVAGRAQFSGWMRNIGKQRWVRVSPIFFLGTVVTAAGTTVYQSDATIFAGMILMGIGVIAMWIAEIGKFKLKSFPAPLLFITGSVLTSMSMTINPSNPMLCAGMILTGLGTVLMWLISVDKWGLNAALVALLFVTGIVLEAVSLTVFPSDIMVMIGMIATGIGAFGMWSFEIAIDSDGAEGE